MEEKQELKNVENRLVEHEFMSGDTVFFRQSAFRPNEGKVTKGIINQVSLIQCYDNWRYNIEVIFEDYDTWLDDGSTKKYSQHLNHSSTEKTCFKSLEELQAYEYKPMDN